MLFILLLLACMQVFSTLGQSICWRQDIENLPFYVDFLVVLQNKQFAQWKRVGVGMSILYQAHQDDTLPRGWKGLATWPVLEPMEGEDDRAPQGWIGGREAQPQREALWG